MIIDDIRSGQNGSQQSVLNLVRRFYPVLKKYARQLETEDAYFDLQAEFLEIIFRFDFDKLRTRSEGAIVQYLSQSIYHAYIKLLRQLIDKKVPTVSVEDLPDSVLYRNSIIYEIPHNSFAIPATLLTPLEAEVFNLICIEGYSAAELARKKGVSRQSINQTKQRALSKLQRFFTKKVVV